MIYKEEQINDLQGQIKEKDKSIAELEKQISNLNEEHVQSSSKLADLNS